MSGRFHASSYNPSHPQFHPFALPGWPAPVPYPHPAVAPSPFPQYPWPQYYPYPQPVVYGYVPVQPSPQTYNGLHATPYGQVNVVGRGSMQPSQIPLVAPIENKRINNLGSSRKRKRANSMNSMEGNIEHKEGMIYLQNDEDGGTSLKGSGGVDSQSLSELLVAHEKTSEYFVSPFDDTGSIPLKISDEEFPEPGSSHDKRTCTESEDIRHAPVEIDVAGSTNANEIFFGSISNTPLSLPADEGASGDGPSMQEDMGGERLSGRLVEGVTPAGFLSEDQGLTESILEESSQSGCVRQDADLPSIPSGACLTGRFGTEFPPAAETITWKVQDLVTVLPFTKCAQRVSQDLDVTAVKHMAMAPDAFRATEGDKAVVAVIRLPKEDPGDSIPGLTDSAHLARIRSARIDVLRQIRDALSRDIPVVVMPWTPDSGAIGFDEEAIGLLCGSLHREVEWQDATLRSEAREDPANSGAHIHRTSTLHEFIKLADNPTVCGNVLDVPDLGGEQPWFVKEISDDTLAWNLTQNIGYADEARFEAENKSSRLSCHDMKKTVMKQSHKRCRKNTLDNDELPSISVRESTIPPVSSVTTRNTPSREAESEDASLSDLSDLTESDCESDAVPFADVSSPSNSQNIATSLAGPQAVLFDSFRLKFWHLITHGGFFSHRHHDAAGLCTWVTVRTGLKVWGLLDVKLGSGSDKRSVLTTKHNQMAGTPEDQRYLQVAEAHNIVLTSGMVLIQPPGKWHQVYTPVKSVVTGGHFLSYDTLHLTEFSRWVDRKLDDVATNAEHPGILRILCRLVFALSYVETSRKIYRRPFLSLARMILKWKDYLHADSTRFHAGDFAEQLQELNAAQSKIKKICAANRISERDIEHELRNCCLGWPRAMEETIDLSAVRAN